MKILRIAVLATGCAAALAGCRTGVTPAEPVLITQAGQQAPAVSPRDAKPKPPGRTAARAPLPGVELTGELMHKMLVAEIALQRGQPHIAIPIYLELARETRDPRVAQRATEIAWDARFTEAALGAWVYWKPSGVEVNTYALSTLKAQEVTRLRVERLDAAQADPPAPIALERQPTGWRITAPFAARADAGQIERLLALVEARSAARYPATDLARYGLDPPQGRLTANDQAFAYGTLNAMTREQYVLAGDAVHAVPIARASPLPRDAEALLARTLFAPGEAPVRFELPHFVMALEDGTWKLTPAANDTSADVRNAWVDGWRNASAIRARRHDGRPAPAAVRVMLKDGRTLELGLLQREPELVLLRADEGVQYHFVAEIGKRLLAPPGSTGKPEAK